MGANDPDGRLGLLCALGAYTIWGLVLPVYLKVLGHVSPIEVVAHRILWSIPLALAVLWWQGLLASALGFLRQPRTLGLAAVTAALISLNWSVYVYAIGGGRAVEAALGYYINPLVNIVLATVFLGERPSRAQGMAIALATTGVVIMTVSVGTLPWISLALALTFGSYGLLRKVAPFGASEGFFLEVTLLALPAAALLLFAVRDHHFGADPLETVMLIGSGPLTAAPLILYAAGARLLRFSTISILQYSSPTLIFLTAIFLFDEPFGTAQLVAFGFIWTALAIYTAPLLRGARRSQPAGIAGETKL